MRLAPPAGRPSALPRTSSRGCRYVALAALLLVAGAGLQATSPLAPRPMREGAQAPWRNLADIRFTKGTLVEAPEQERMLQKMIALYRAGRPFVPEEVAILDAYNAGLPITQLEAQLVISRALFAKIIEGKPLDENQDALYGQYTRFAFQNKAELLQRNAQRSLAAGRALPSYLAGGKEDPAEARAWELYSNPELFNRLDGLQRVLELKFGMKGGITINAPQASNLAQAYVIPGLGFGSDETLPINNTGVNNRLADPGAQDTQSETTVVLANGGVVASFNDSGSYNPAAKFTGYARSTDGGNSWTDLGALPTTANGDVGDPVLARSNTSGSVFLATLAFTGDRLQIFRSTDGGATFGSTPADGTAGAPSGGFHDKEWITTYGLSTGPKGKQSNVFCAWRDFGSGGGLSFTRSLDDGLTFQDRQVLSASTPFGDFSQGAWPVVGADGAVYTFWLDVDPTISNYVLTLRKSTDGGLTFAPRVDAQTLRTLGTNGNLGLGGGFRTNAFPQVVASPSNPQQLFMVWNDKAPVGTDKANIYLSQTTDGGATWSAAVQVNADATTNDQWQPVLAITPDGSRIFVSWYDRRLDPSNSRFEVFGRIATVSGSTLTWGNDFRITDGDSPVIIGQDPVINTTYMGDYDQAVSDGTFWYRTWADNRLPSNAHANQPDVRVGKIPIAGPGALLAAGARTLTGESCAPANSAPDPGETETVSFTINNTGTGSTTNLVATLLSTGGVTLPSGAQSFGAIPAGGSATRTFTFRTSGACGGTVTPTFSLVDGASTYPNLSFAPMTIGAPGGSITTSYSSGAISVPVPASGTVGNMTDQVINVGASGIVSKVVAKIRLNHTWDSDLNISLVSPNGTVVPLSTGNGGSGDNFGSGATNCTGTFTVFDDAAATAITAGGAPFAGSYKPQSVLSAMNGGPVNGNWTLKITDTASGDAGFLYCWGLDLTYSGITCTTCPASADVRGSGSVSPATLVAGGTATYTATGTNFGPDPVQDMTVCGYNYAPSTFVSATASAGGSVYYLPPVGGADWSCAVWWGATNVGVSRSISVTVNIPAGTPGGTVVPFLVSAQSNGNVTPDPVPANNQVWLYNTIVNTGPGGGTGLGGVKGDGGDNK